MTYYDILGISRTAEDAEIKKAYHQMIIAFHPDKYQGDKQFAADKTQEIIDAYKVLRNPIKRNIYDNQLNAQNAAENRARNQKDTNTGTSDHSQKAKTRGLKIALIVLGAVFFIFVVLLFLTILLNIHA